MDKYEILMRDTVVLEHIKIITLVRWLRLKDKKIKELKNHIKYLGEELEKERRK